MPCRIEFVVRQWKALVKNGSGDPSLLAHALKQVTMLPLSVRCGDEEFPCPAGTVFSMDAFHATKVGLSPLPFPVLDPVSTHPQGCLTSVLSPVSSVSCPASGLTDLCPPEILGFLRWRSRCGEKLEAHAQLSGSPPCLFSSVKTFYPDGMGGSLDQRSVR